MKAVLSMKELGIKTKRIAELLPISKNTFYRIGIRRSTENKKVALIKVNGTINKAANYPKRSNKVKGGIKGKAEKRRINRQAAQQQI